MTGNQFPAVRATTGAAAGALGIPLIGRSSPWLAPLAGHTDLTFRTLCREQGAAVACTEMVSAKGLVYGEERRGKKRRPATAPQEGAAPNTKCQGETPLHSPALRGQTDGGASATRELLLTTAADSPLVVQLFGEDPYFLGRAVELLRGWGFGWFDLNLGCSVPKVVKTGAGAALARSVPAAVAALRAMLEAAGPLEESALAPAGGALAPRSRVGCKIRLGWSREEENYRELAAGLEEAGAGWLTLHPRYARQGFSGQADYRAVAVLARQLEVPLMASGDLFEAAEALTRLEESGASGLMFARGALQNPALFRDYLDLANGGKGEEPRLRSASDPAFLRALILRHAELAQALFATASERAQKRKRNMPRPETALLKMRGAVPRYIKDLPGSRAFRVKLSSCASWEQFHELVEAYFSGLG